MVGQPDVPLWEVPQPVGDPSLLAGYLKRGAGGSGAGRGQRSVWRGWEGKEGRGGKCGMGLREVCLGLSCTAIAPNPSDANSSLWACLAQIEVLGQQGAP